MIALIVVDMINAFVEKDSPLCVSGAKETVPRIKNVVDACRSRGSYLFHCKGIQGRWIRRGGQQVEILE
jgi:nicotinamidase-related amidase